MRVRDLATQLWQWMLGVVGSSLWHWLRRKQQLFQRHLHSISPRILFQCTFSLKPPKVWAHFLYGRYHMSVFSKFFDTWRKMWKSANMPLSQCISFGLNYSVFKALHREFEISECADVSGSFLYVRVSFFLKFCIDGLESDTAKCHQKGQTW